MSTPEQNGDARIGEVFSERNEKAQTKEGLERRLQEISRMKSDPQGEIARLQSQLEATFRTAESLDSEEETIRRLLAQLE